MKKAIIITAPSGAGKTTLVKRVLAQMDKDVSFSISITTRRPRQDEKHGKDYYFVNIKNFQEKIKENALLEWEQVYEGIYYGSLKSEINRIAKEGKIALFDIDVLGATQIKRKLGDNALSIFIRPPNKEELYRRLKNRQTENYADLKERFERSEKELEYEKSFDHSIINDILEDAEYAVIQTIKKFIQT